MSHRQSRGTFLGRYWPCDPGFPRRQVGPAQDYGEHLADDGGYLLTRARYHALGRYRVLIRSTRGLRKGQTLLVRARTVWPLPPPPPRPPRPPPPPPPPPPPLL